LDPLSPYIHVGAVWPVLFSRRYDQAIEQLQRVVALNPDFNSAQVNLGWAYEWKGRREEAITAYNKALTLDKLWFTYASLGYSYAKAGKTDEARKILAQLQEKARREYVPPYGYAIVHAGLGEKDQAFAALENSFAARDEYMSYIKIYPFFDGLRPDPRFTDLVRRMRLAP
jgi:Flp pilus assembly protein TadD